MVSRCSSPRPDHVFAEYYDDAANGNIATWKMVRTGNVKYIQTYNATGGVTFREYYNLTNDPVENTNLLGDGNPPTTRRRPSSPRWPPG